MNYNLKPISSILMELKADLVALPILLSLLGSAILAFGLYEIHSFSTLTEGGVLGATLLIHYWFHISPSVSGFIMNALAYFFGWRSLGHRFILYSAISGGGFSLFYALFENTLPPLFGFIYDKPLLTAIIGAVFVGVGAGLPVRMGGAPSGDDAIAMTLNHKFPKIPLQWFYLLTDLTVLGLSLSYIPLNRMLYSLITVIISGQLIGVMMIGKKSEKSA